MSVLAIDFTQPFEDAFGKLLGFIPNLLGGIAILVVGYFVAKVLGSSSANCSAGSASTSGWNEPASPAYCSGPAPG